MNHRLSNIPRLDLVGKPVEDFNPSEAQWKNTLRLSESPWIAEHKIQDGILYPAAGMLCAVLEASKQLASEDKTVKGFEFRDIIIGRALIVPSDDHGVSMTLHIRPRKIGTKGTDASWMEFTVYSQSKDSEHIEHCSGLIQTQYEARTEVSDSEDEEIREWHGCKDEYLRCQKACTDTVNMEEFYSDLASRGMQYGTWDINTFS